jgi:hypothetical protein
MCDYSLHHVTHRTPWQLKSNVSSNRLLKGRNARRLPLPFVSGKCLEEANTRPSTDPCQVRVESSAAHAARADIFTLPWTAKPQQSASCARIWLFAMAV